MRPLWVEKIYLAQNPANGGRTLILDNEHPRVRERATLAFVWRTTGEMQGERPKRVTDLSEDEALAVCERVITEMTNEQGIIRAFAKFRNRHDQLVLFTPDELVEYRNTLVAGGVNPAEAEEALREFGQQQQRVQEIKPAFEYAVRTLAGRKVSFSPAEILARRAFVAKQNRQPVTAQPSFC